MPAVQAGLCWAGATAWAAYLMCITMTSLPTAAASFMPLVFGVFSSTANDAAAWTKYLDADGWNLTDDPEALIRFLKNR